MTTLINLKEKIIVEKLERKTSISNISVEIGLSSSYLSKFFDFLVEKENCHEIKFEILLKVINRYYTHPQDILEIVTDFSKRATKPQNLRLLLEFADEYQDNSLLFYIINKCTKFPNRSLVATVAIYELLYKRKTSNLSMLDYREQLAIHKSDVNKDDAYLVLILESYLLYDLRSYSLLSSNIIILEELFSELSCEGYLKNRCFERKEEIKMRYFLISNQLVLSRETANNILQVTNNPKLLASSYYTLGMSYLFSSFEKCDNFLKKSFSLYNKIGNSSKNIVENYRAFAKCFHNKPIIDSNSLSKLDEIYLMIQQKNIKNAQSMLNTFLISTKVEDYQLPFIIFLIGKLKSDKDLLWQSYTEYIRQGDFFFSNIPMFELKNMGVNYFKIDKYIKGDYDYEI